MDFILFFWEDLKVPVLLTGLWLLIVCAALVVSKGSSANSLVSLLSIGGPLVWSIPSIWFIGLPVVFLFGITGLGAKAQSQSKIAQSIGNGLLIGVALGMLCRGIISVASGR